MKETTIRFMRDFRCIADQCRHSCCIGWEIDIDEDSLDYYRSIEGDFGRRLQQGITEDAYGAHFVLDKEERCPFLNKCGLCDIYSTLGEEALCNICTDHPRFRNYIAGNCEIGIGLCCEAAAKLILSQKEKWEADILWDDGEAEETDAFTLWLLALRQKLFDLLQSGDSTALCAEKMMDSLGITLPDIDLAGKLLSLERLEDIWDTYLFSLASADKRVWEEEMPSFDAEFRNLLLYFLYRHLPSATCVAEAKARVGFAYLSYRIVRALCAKTEDADIYEIARLYSAEIEYSEENTEKLFALWEDEL
jgi:lysine-N-methylase